ncbi:MAG: aldehyde dehydrogenase family protein [Pseudomonadota bacterium]
MAHQTEDTRSDARAILQGLGVTVPLDGGGLIASSPIDGGEIAALAETTPAEIEQRIAAANEAFLKWRMVPAPVRGEFVRLLSEKLRANKDALGRLVTLDCGKPVSEGLGEVQEMIDICDFAVGLSRQLYGLTIASERVDHRLQESWHPLGPVGVISAFNFPVAVWSWNAALAFVCGNSVVWKPSEKTPLTALGVQALVEDVMREFDVAPEGLSSVIIGGRDAGERLVDQERIALVSATGSTAMGRAVGERAARRFARTILELGGNNAAIVAPSADVDLAVRGVLFSAFGTSGQRCTTLRRLFLHEEIHDAFLSGLTTAAASIRVGDPRASENLMGPLIDAAALEGMQSALDEARAHGGEVIGGERVETDGGVYVRPAIVAMPEHVGPALRETFAPILYVFRYRDLESAIALQNSVGAGLSSSIFTNDVREEGLFLSAAGSDCGIANVNIGTSGAEIGGAFGGEKETGGGRESGSDAWKGYMRRATNTINYGSALPLAQGVEFNLD